jgi:hypothetical protein
MDSNFQILNMKPLAFREGKVWDCSSMRGFQQ